MKLNLEQIKNLTVGAVDVALKDDGIHFYKMQKCQIDAFYALSEILGFRAETTTGIRLDFETDSKFLAFEIKSGTRFEYLIDGVYQGTVKDSRIDLAEPCRVTLCFPSHEIGIIDNVELSDGASATRHKFDRKILFIGDSITQGWNSGIDTLSYAYRTSFALNCDSIIQGVGGAYYHESTFADSGFEPNTIIVAYGTNDVNHFKTKDEMIEQLRLYLGKVKETYKQSKIYAISPIWVSGGNEEKRMGNLWECYDLIAEEIEKIGIEHIRGLDLVSHEKCLFADDLHPNKDGFEEYAKNLVKVIG
ncbi:MAG: SGNH/GDSL hydrolase family protein [Clostridia bacterium]|nr:SGNH/GDSL hydrolase family protein [Clostridia bacterium]